ncbi:endonuclease/exonuclease/phosphatase family protein [Marinilabilia rubra]|uniref:Endonuclease/exonuclease/phosphatase n=1 Tax=Marinilabilia rubra TaxID=2162893 RepID=A0A2U2B8T0_9BACT|nr:endonuclease/exonuclease/phosphatase family protein [Marinilabilia rubra]PWD99453.1 endonuclease/exonuclease/phosphatase [Marinilabilia rubra]
MKFSMAILLLAIGSFFGCQNNQDYLEVISFNVRYASDGDGSNVWDNRVPLIKTYFEENRPDVVGMQEVLPRQLLDLKKLLPIYQFVSAGRSDGKSEGEACPVFYRKDLYNEIESGNFWLSETPDEAGSMDWDTHFPRIVTWVHLVSKITGKEFFFVNTHFSHISEEARVNSADMLLKQIHKRSGDKPVILTGDFNTPKGSKPYNRLIQGHEEEIQLRNAEEVAQTSYNGEITYNAFDPEFAGTRIDFIFVTTDFEVRTHSVDEIKKDSVFISDHYPVRAEVIL